MVYTSTRNEIALLVYRATYYVYIIGAFEHNLNLGEIDDGVQRGACVQLYPLTEVIRLSQRQTAKREVSNSHD